MLYKVIEPMDRIVPDYHKSVAEVLADAIVNIAMCSSDLMDDNIVSICMLGASMNVCIGGSDSVARLRRLLESKDLYLNRFDQHLADEFYEELLTGVILPAMDPAEAEVHMARSPNPKARSLWKDQGANLSGLSGLPESNVLKHSGASRVLFEGKSL
jgi:hypothetical protein